MKKIIFSLSILIVSCNKTENLKRVEEVKETNKCKVTGCEVVLISNIYESIEFDSSNTNAESGGDYLFFKNDSIVEFVFGGDIIERANYDISGELCDTISFSSTSYGTFFSFKIESECKLNRLLSNGEEISYEQ